LYPTKRKEMVCTHINNRITIDTNRLLMIFVFFILFFSVREIVAWFFKSNDILSMICQQQKMIQQLRIAFDKDHSGH